MSNNEQTDNTKNDGAENEDGGLVSHLAELRSRLIMTMITFIVACLFTYYFHSEIFNFLSQPFSAQQKSFNADNAMLTNGMIATALYEPFLVYIKVSVWAAFFLISPVMFLHIWRFIAPALYDNEKKFFMPIFILTPALFLLGACMAYYVVFPRAWEFFLSFQQLDTTQTQITIQPKIDQYLDLAMSLILAFGICFELPMLLAILTKVKIIEPDDLKNYRRYAIVTAFVIAAIMTPPDILSQFLLAVPLLFLYEISIIISTMIHKNNLAEDERIQKEYDSHSVLNEEGIYNDDDFSDTGEEK